MIKFIKALIKANTNTSEINLEKKFATGDFGHISNYLKILMVNVRDHAHKYKYTTHHKAIYRGVHPKTII